MSVPKNLDRAVTLAAAFVANGGIRIDNVPIRVDTTPIAQLEDLIVALPLALDSTEALIAYRRTD